jgi:DNA-binding transcriptional ArsR family regulator
MIANHPEREQIRLENVLFALGNPLRLEIIRILADGSEQSCNALRHEDVAKSTMTHHWRVLRDSGVIWQRPQGRENMISLRREDLDARFPGLLDTLLKVMHAAKACAPAPTPHRPAADTGQSGRAHPPRFG